jgi:hypothetical protein
VTKKETKTNSTKRSRKDQKRNTEKKKPPIAVVRRARTRSCSYVDHVEVAGATTPSDLSMDVFPYLVDQDRKLGPIILDRLVEVAPLSPLKLPQASLKPSPEPARPSPPVPPKPKEITVLIAIHEEVKASPVLRD